MSSPAASAALDERTGFLPTASPIPIRQATLRAPVSVSGVGMHSGVETRVSIRPAGENHGLSFLTDGVRIPARAGFVVNAKRCTCLGLHGAHVDTVEHLLSALYGLRVDNAEILVDGPEIPILDGSARSWTDLLESAGIEAQEAVVDFIDVDGPVVLRTGDSWLVATSSPNLILSCVTEYDHPMLGIQAMSYVDDPRSYVTEIAPARTFGFASEIQDLQAAGLALGGSLDNALIIFEDHFSSELRVPHECMRHKALDLIGDLALAGRRLRAAITAIRPSHQANVEFAALLARGDGGRRDPGVSRGGTHG